GAPLPRQLSDWRTQGIVGLLLLGGGNALVVWAEQYTGSGTASIFVVTVALWMAFFDAIIPGGSGELGWRVIAGLILGFLGTGLLVGANPAEILHADLRGPLALTCASASWSLGSVYSKRHKTNTSPYIGAALQMLAGGGAVALLGTALGEWSRWHLTAKGVYSDPKTWEFARLVSLTWSNQRQSVNLAEKFRLFEDYYSPKMAGELNDSYVKLVKLKGEFVWHLHEAEDELFLVVKGR